MRLTLNWMFEGKEVSLVRDQVISRFALRTVKRLDGNDTPTVMEAFELSKEAEIKYNGKTTFTGSEGDQVIVTPNEMYIMKGKLFAEEFVKVEGRTLKADFKVLAEENMKMEPVEDGESDEGDRGESN